MSSTHGADLRGPPGPATELLIRQVCGGFPGSAFDTRSTEGRWRAHSSSPPLSGLQVTPPTHTQNPLGKTTPKTEGRNKGKEWGKEGERETNTVSSTNNAPFLLQNLLLQNPKHGIL